MNLHDVHERPAEPAPTDTVPRCPNCPGRSLNVYRCQYGSFREIHSLNFTDNPNTYPGEEWDDLDQTTADSDPWQCNWCRRRLPDDVQGWIDDHR